MSDKMVMIATPIPQDMADEIIDRKGGLRLTNAMRESVVKKALAHAFSKRDEALVKEEHRIAHLFMVKAFGMAKLEAAAMLGAPWVSVCEDGYGTKQENGIAVSWNAGGRAVQVRHLDPVPVPAYAGPRRSKFFIIKDEKLVERAHRWQDDSVELDNERNKVRNTLTAMLQSISTFKSLESQWPEGKQFFKHLPKDFPYRHQVPATLVSELNKSLGI